MKALLFTSIMILSTSAMALPAGRYVSDQLGQYIVLLTIFEKKALKLEYTSQVASGDDQLKEGDVPFLTLCRLKVWGKIVNENPTHYEYEVKTVQLGDLSDLKWTEHCQAYVDFQNGRNSVISEKNALPITLFKKEQ